MSHAIGKAAAAGLALLLGAASAGASTQVNISIGDSGYRGVLPALSGWRPEVWNSSPVVAIGAAAAGLAAVYLNVTDSERRDWKRHCGKYDACGRPVYFVKNDWYRGTYAPEYRRRHPAHPAYHDDHRPLPPGQAKRMDRNPPAPGPRGDGWRNDGPRGPQGSQRPQGPQGPQGPGPHGPDRHDGPRH